MTGIVINIRACSPQILTEIANALGATAAQVALAWLLSRGDDVVPIPATRLAARINENAATMDVQLTPADLHQLERASPPGVAARTRYPLKQLGNMSS